MLWRDAEVGQDDIVAGVAAHGNDVTLDLAGADDLPPGGAGGDAADDEGHGVALTSRRKR